MRRLYRAAFQSAFTGLLAGFGSLCLAAGESELEPITVTATQIATPAFDVPASISLVPREAFNTDTLGVNLSEGLSAVPGLIARNRQNYAQDIQISIRAFGARSTFGIRGVRLYLDGIPATQPDGQGQVSHFNLATAGSVEVLRGPFSALHGNSSGGVIQLFTADGNDPAEVSFGTAAGSFGTWRANIGAGGTATVGAQPLDYTVGYTHFETDGFREHSAARRDAFNGKTNIRIGGAGRLTLLLNSFSSSDAQDPLGLTREQFEEDPRQATAVAEQFNTRKSVDQTQAGAIYEHRFGETQTLRLLGYAGNRAIEQFLAIPVGAQGNSTHSGGVIDLDTDFAGLDARWTLRTELAQRPFSVALGASYNVLEQDRRGYENFSGEELGVRGALRRDETNEVDDFDPYLQASWSFAERWSALAGVRYNRVTFESEDRYVTEGNPDDSGRMNYSRTTPVAGLMYRHNPSLHLHAAYGSGFETPTLVELAYRPDGSSGLNRDLDAARTRNAEIGAKLRLQPALRAELALFHADTRDELVVATNSGGRATYQNAGRTRRLGVEAGATAALSSQLELSLAYTWIEAEVREPYFACTGVPCTVPETRIEKGNRLPGVPESSFYGTLHWGADTGWQASVDAQYMAAVPVNDVNSEAAPSYALVGVSGAYVRDFPHLRLRGFVTVDNLFDRDHVGSVIVNDGNGRYYEPGAELSVLAGIRLGWRR